MIPLCVISECYYNQDVHNTRLCACFGVPMVFTLVPTELEILPLPAMDLVHLGTQRKSISVKYHTIFKYIGKTRLQALDEQSVMKEAAATAWQRLNHCKLLVHKGKYLFQVNKPFTYQLRSSQIQNWCGCVNMIYYNTRKLAAQTVYGPDFLFTFSLIQAMISPNFRS